MAELVTFLTADGREVDAWGRTIEKQQDDAEWTPEQQAAGEVDYDSLTADELKAELKRRQDEGRKIDTTQIKKKSDLVDALKADDEARSAEA